MNMNSIFDIPTNYSSSGNAYVSQEIQDKWPTYEFLGKPIRLGNGKTYMRAYHKILEQTHYYEFGADWFHWDKPDTSKVS